MYICIIIMIIIWNRAKHGRNHPQVTYIGTLVWYMLEFTKQWGDFRATWPNIPKYIQISTAGCAITILKNDGLRQWVVDCPIYEMENKQCSKPPTRQGFLGISKDRDETSGESLGITTPSGPVDCLNGLQKNRFWKATSQHERCFGFLQPFFFVCFRDTPKSLIFAREKAWELGVPQNFSRLSPKP